MRNDHISYFVNVSRSLDDQSVIAGDRNLATNGRPLTGYGVISDARALTWTKSIHEHGGDVAMVDGSAHQITTRLLQQCFTNTPIHLAIP